MALHSPANNPNTSGTNTGDVTVGPIGASPNANAATLAGQVLNLEPASASFGGVVTTGSQTIAGAKVFSGGVDVATLKIASLAGVLKATAGTVGVTTIAGTDLTVSISTITSNTAAVSGTTYLCNTSGGAFTLTLPAHSSGSWVEFKDSNGNFETNNLTIARNGGTGNIEGVAASLVVYASWSSGRLVSDGTGWFLI